MQNPDMAMGIKGSTREITCKGSAPPPEDFVSPSRPSPLFRPAIHVAYFGATLRLTLLSSQDKPFVPMIDHIFGRPSPSWKRTQVGVQLVRLFDASLPNCQVLFVLTFWIWRLAYGREVPPRLLWLRKMNRTLGSRACILIAELRAADMPCAARFSPWQIIVGTLTAMYASRNLDKLLGLGGMHMFCPWLSLTHTIPRLFPVAVRWTSPGTPC